MEQSTNAVGGAAALASGLRKTLTAAEKRWTQWPTGANDLAKVADAVEGIRQRLAAAATADDPSSVAASCIDDLRAVLEWMTYQSQTIATAQALAVARKTRRFVERFGVGAATPGIVALFDSEPSIIESIRTRNAAMIAIAGRHEHLALPAPLIDPGRLVEPVRRKPSRLDFIQRLRKAAKESQR
ncbi:MAG: hypothetical protein JO359_04235 [Candidatus Eremiobacteraeota bacterium]|nr:hypothetical protein [Candidatus Eremiobacteraeota bacterium]